MQYRQIPEDERRWHKDITDILVGKYQVWGTLPKWDWTWLEEDGSIVNAAGEILNFQTGKFEKPLNQISSVQNGVQSTVAKLI